MQTNTTCPCCGDEPEPLPPSTERYCWHCNTTEFTQAGTSSITVEDGVAALDILAQDALRQHRAGETRTLQEFMEDTDDRGHSCGHVAGADDCDCGGECSCGISYVDSVDWLNVLVWGTIMAFAATMTLLAMWGILAWVTESGSVGYGSHWYG